MDPMNTAHRHIAAAAACGLLLTLCGCNSMISGRWDLQRATPNREFFAIDDAVFTRDGRYEATLTIEGRTARESGSYRFNGYKLMLHPQAGGRREYDAVLKMKNFEVRDGSRLVVLRKEES